MSEGENAVLIRCQVRRGAFSAEPIVEILTTESRMARLASDIDFLFVGDVDGPRKFTVEDYDNEALEGRRLVLGRREVTSKNGVLVAFWNNHREWVRPWSIAYRNVPVEFNWVPAKEVDA